MPKCTSCGVILQNHTSHTPGYFIDPSAQKKTPRVKRLDQIYEANVKSLSDEDKQLLLNGATGDLLQRPFKDAPKITKFQCLRCRGAQYESQYDTASFKMESVLNVMQQIPSFAKVAYVLSAVDFPMSLNEDVFKFKSAKSMQFIVTKSDLLFPTKGTAMKKGLSFFQDYLERTYHVPRENVHLVSGSSDWGTDNILDHVRDRMFFIGSVNAGKSTLLQLLIFAAQKRQDALPNARKLRQQQKHENEAANKSYAAKREYKRQRAEYMVKNGPGVSFMPGYTQDIIPVPLSNTITVYDAPGFSTPASAHIAEFMSVPAIRQLNKGAPLYKHGLHTLSYQTAKGGQVITVGGLFFMQVPHGSMFRYRNMFNHKAYVFGSMESAMQSWREPKNPDAMQDVFFVDPKANMVKHVVPPFHGSFDFVVRGLGFMNITATGAKPDPAHAADLVVYLPQGVEAASRLPITQFVTQTLTGKDKFGNPLRKEKWVRQSTTELKKYKGDVPLSRPVTPAV